MEGETRAPVLVPRICFPPQLLHKRRREGVGRTLHERETMDSSIFAFLFSPIYVNFKTVAEAAVSLLFFLFCFLSFTLE